MRLKKAVTNKALDAVVAYEKRRQEWARSTAPLHPVITYLTSRRRGLPIPTWVLKWLDAGLQRWVDSQGDGGKALSLESALALSGVGKRRAAQSTKRSQLLFGRFLDTARLCEIGSLKVSDAAYLVCCRAHPELYDAADAASADRLQRKASTLAQEFSHFEGRADLRTFYEVVRSRLPELDAKQDAQFVATFPRREILRHAKLKRLLS